MGMFCGNRWIGTIFLGAIGSGWESTWRAWAISRRAHARSTDRHGAGKNRQTTLSNTMTGQRAGSSGSVRKRERLLAVTFHIRENKHSQELLPLFRGNLFLYLILCVCVCVCVCVWFCYQVSMTTETHVPSPPQ